jgi:hypothetical protein
MLNNRTQQVYDFGLYEGLGEPEIEKDHQNKIIAKRKEKKRTSCLKLKEGKLNENNLSDIIIVPKTTRNNHLINFKDYDSESSKMFKTENLSARLGNGTGNGTGELYDPTQIIKEFKHKFHHHSKSGMSQEFKPLVQKQRPKILVEGDEMYEEDTDINNLLCSSRTRPKTNINKINLEIDTSSNVRIEPTKAEQRMQKLDRTIEDLIQEPFESIDNYNDEIIPLLTSQKAGFEEDEFSLKENNEILNQDFIKGWQSARFPHIKIESHK